MTEQTKSAWSTSRHRYAREAGWAPLRSWWENPGLLSHQEFGGGGGGGASPFPDQLSWLDGTQRRAAAYAWPGYLSSPLIPPSVQGAMRHPWPRPARGAEGGGAEPYRWRVSLDVLHFAPAELSLRTRGDFLEVGGKHDERRDDHGFIARCFTRKYKLPIGVDPAQIRSRLSEDGFLLVDAPLPEPGAADIFIPVQVEEAVRTDGEEEEEEQGGGVENRHPPPSAPAAPENPESASDEPSAQAPPLGGASPETPGAGEAGQQGGGGGGEEEQAPPSASAGDQGGEALPESPGPAQPAGGAGGSAQEPEPGGSPSEQELSQELASPEAPDMEQQDITK